jgi:hypothetical protein
MLIILGNRIRIRIKVKSLIRIWSHSAIVAHNEPRRLTMEPWCRLITLACGGCVM